MKKTKESDVQKQILQWLTMKKIFHWRNNVGGMSGSHNGKPWFVRFGKPGMPDIFAVTYCPAHRLQQNVTGNHFPAMILSVYAIEVKSSTGKQSEVQRAWQSEAERNGIIYILARSLDDVIKVVERAHA